VNVTRPVCSSMEEFLANTKGYRFGFNGKEHDDETYGEGNVYDYGFRIYNPRVGKFLTVDPLSPKYPWYSPFQFAGNKPIWAKDLDGLEECYSCDMRADRIAAQQLAGEGATAAQVQEMYARIHFQGGPMTLEELHTTLDALGFIPLLGELADGTNALIYLAEGDKQNATFSAISLIPVIGDVAGKGTKYTIKASKYFKVGDRIFQSAKSATKYDAYFSKYGSKVANAIWDAGRGGSNKLAKALGTKAGDVAHHVIPVELIEKSPLLQKAINEGFDFNGAINGMIIKQRGSHPDSYWQGVQQVILATQKSMPKASAKEIMEVVSTKLKTMIQSNGNVVNTVFKK